MTEGYVLQEDSIVINRTLNDLDLFVQEFLKILKQHSKYLVVSGYISISTGRVRGTEDVDVLIPVLKKEGFERLFAALGDADFWCYQTDNAAAAFEQLKAMSSIRFAKKNQMFPNMELIPVTPEKHAQWFELHHPQKYRVADFEFFGSPVEFEIIYKEEVLKGQKDLEDAKHLRKMFEKVLKEETFKAYKKMFKEWNT